MLTSTHAPAPLSQAQEELRALQAAREAAARDAQWRGHYAVDEDDEW